MKPPNILDGANVLFWAWSGEEPFGYVCNEDGTERQEIHGLAICQYEGTTEVYRFSCDNNWKTIQDGLYDTVEEAINWLPAQYKNVVANWQPL